MRQMSLVPHSASQAAKGPQQGQPPALQKQKQKSQNKNHEKGAIRSGLRRVTRLREPKAFAIASPTAGERAPSSPGASAGRAKTGRGKFQKFRNPFRNSKVGCFPMPTTQKRPEMPGGVGIASPPHPGAPATEAAERGQPFRPPCRGPEIDKRPRRGPKIEKSAF